MANKELMIAKRKQQILKARLDKAEKILGELQTKKSKEEAEAITRVILSINDENVLMEIVKLVDIYVISPADRKILGLTNRRSKNEQ